MSLEAGLLVIVFVAAVGFFVKTHRGASTVTTGIAHAADAPSTPGNRSR
jgi:autotransporter translocation and assembly factor TamB